MWLNVLKYMRRKLEERNIRVIVGGIPPTNAEVTNDGCCILMRGEEQPSDSLEEYSSDLAYNITFYIETWVRSDSDSLEEGYQLLSTFETKVEEVVSSIILNLNSCHDDIMVDDTWQILSVGISRKTGDADSLRPLVGTQYEVAMTIFRTGGVY